MPELQASIDGNDADRCVHLLPRVRGLRRVAAAETGRLLRVLFLRLGSLSPNPGQPVMLRDAGQPIGAEGACVEARADWASGLRGGVYPSRSCSVWGASWSSPSHRVSMHPEDGRATPELLEPEAAQSTTMCGTKRAVSRVISELSSRMPMPDA
jgi:hypothetical protein